MFSKLLRMIAPRGHLAWQIVASGVLLFLLLATFLPLDPSTGTAHLGIDRKMLLVFGIAFGVTKTVEIAGRAIWRHLPGLAERRETGRDPDEDGSEVEER